MHTRTWTVRVHVFEQDNGRTSAEAVLETDVGTVLRHRGVARRNPADPDVPEIGDELAVCRALSGLGHDLLEAALSDVALNAASSAGSTV
ncbi:DUF1876 domain-containing protein [Marmoricola sp. RAF53]|uniref:DUF1876 domain-containing protein n=1 Tax=Marmoricola sp. RAF53 TaxID=3233059 RepID=UPI003F97C4A3